jgi:hypothetical protein
MSDHISHADAVVALRSFGRRYSEVLAGPPDDDAWERLIRTSGSGGHSAFDEVRHAAAKLGAVAALCVALPTVQAPSAATGVMPSESLETAALITAVRSAAGSAGDALEARSDDDDERSVTVNEVAVSFGSYISTTVKALADGVRRAERAIENAR